MKFDEFKIKQICDNYGIRNYTIVDGLVNVDGDVNLRGKGLTKLPVQFGIVTGNFLCWENNLTTLEGSPREVIGGFSCGFNQLTTLEGSPREVGKNFYCSNNKQLTSLVGAPELIEGKFYCINTPVHSIFQSEDSGLIPMFNAIFMDSVDMDLIEYWFGLINKPFIDEAIEEIKKYYQNI
jgi:hypothetical protein